MEWLPHPRFTARYLVVSSSRTTEQVIERKFSIAIMNWWLRFSADITPSGHPPIVDGDVFEQGLARLANNCRWRAGELRFQGYEGLIRAQGYLLLQQALLYAHEPYRWVINHWQ